MSSSGGAGSSGMFRLHAHLLLYSGWLKDCLKDRAERTAFQRAAPLRAVPAYRGGCRNWTARWAIANTDHITNLTTNPAATSDTSESEADQATNEPSQASLVINHIKFCGEHHRAF
jgi:hypothetical protein